MLVITVTAVAFGPAMALRVIHHRDQGAFDRHVSANVGYRQAGDEPDRAWAKGHPELILAEGSRACQWLSERPKAPDVDPTGRLLRDRLVARYLRDTTAEPIALISQVDRWIVVSAAWRYLCWHEQDEHTATFPYGSGD